MCIRDFNGSSISDMFEPTIVINNGEFVEVMFEMGFPDLNCSDTHNFDIIFISNRNIYVFILKYLCISREHQNITYLHEIIDRHFVQFLITWLEYCMPFSSNIYIYIAYAHFIDT